MTINHNYSNKANVINYFMNKYLMFISLSICISSTHCTVHIMEFFRLMLFFQIEVKYYKPVVHQIQSSILFCFSIACFSNPNDQISETNKRRYENRVYENYIIQKDYNAINLDKINNMIIIIIVVRWVGVGLDGQKMSVEI